MPAALGCSKKEDYYTAHTKLVIPTGNTWTSRVYVG